MFMDDPDFLDSFSFSVDSEREGKDDLIDLSDDNPTSTIVLPVMAVVNIMKYVDLKTLYSMAFSSKQFMEVLLVRAVVRAALMKGGRAKMSFDRLYKLLLRNAIWPPSPFRLLRIACGIRCEVCNQAGVSCVHETYGLFVCGSCIASNQAIFERTGTVYLRNKTAINKVLDHQYVLTVKKDWRIVPDGEAGEELVRAQRAGSRVTHDDGRKLKVFDSKCYMWNKVLVDSYGEKCGPVVYPRNVCRLVSLFIDGSKTNWFNIMRRYYFHTLSGPSVGNHHRSSFLISYRGVVSHANERMLLNEFVNATANARRIALKTKLAVDFVERVRFQLDDPTLALRVLNYTINREYGDKSVNISERTYPLVFRFRWVDDIMKDYISRTTSVSAREMSCLAQTIKRTAKEKVLLFGV